MLPFIGDFDTAIKQKARDINVVVAYKDVNRYVFLQKDKIQSLTYNARTDKELGGIVRKVCDIKAMYNEYTLNLTKGTPINLYFKCGDGMCKKSLLYVNQVKTNSAKTLITIEALDYLSYANTNATLPMQKNTDLVSYEKTIFDSLGYEYYIDSKVANPKLSLAYPLSTKLIDTFEEMAEANQAIFDFGVHELSQGDIDIMNHVLPITLPYTFTIPFRKVIVPTDEPFLKIKKFGFKLFDDVIDDASELIDFELDDDNSNQYEDMRVSLFFPSSSDRKSLGKVSATIPPRVTNYNVGTIDFGNTMIPQMCIFDDRVDIASYTIGSDSFSFRVNSTDSLARNIEAEIFGLDISTTTLKDTNTDEKIKQVSNMYIQSATVYDGTIFKYPNCTIKTFGNPLYEVGDTVACGEYDVLIIEETLTFTGGLKSVLKGVAK